VLDDDEVGDEEMLDEPVLVGRAVPVTGARELTLVTVEAGTEVTRVEVPPKLLLAGGMPPLATNLLMLSMAAELADQSEMSAELYADRRVDRARVLS